jgi:hypothetical protein
MPVPPVKPLSAAVLRPLGRRDHRDADRGVLDRQGGRDTREHEQPASRAPTYMADLLGGW